MSKNKKTVVFTEDFATKKAGEEMEVDTLLARDLVNRKVATFKDEPAPKAKAKEVEAVVEAVQTDEEVKTTSKPKKK